MFHANLFPLIRHEPLPVYWYEANVDPQPANRPQLYQILGIISKQILYHEHKPVVGNGSQIMSLAHPITTLNGHVAEIPEVGKFNVDLSGSGNSTVGLDEFDNYRLLVDRLADIALTVLSKEYYKFHPAAPYIIRDEPYFDPDLIEKTGVLDSKKYYRGLHKFNHEPFFVLNRETQLRSNKDLLNEIKSLKKHYESTKKLEIDFYDPPDEFVEYINFLLRGKAADVIRYPGPSIREIKEVTWKYRANDATPGLTQSHIEYLRSTYGVAGLDPDQPLIVYEVEEQKRIQYHVPEVLSIGHTFYDLERRIPSWQRTQVWGIIHPDCKNQLQKIYSVLFEIDETLRRHLPEVYPKLVEISTKAKDISSLVSQPIELNLHFGNKEMIVKSPYDVSFYHNFTEKKISFAGPVGNVKALICLEKRSRKIDVFLTALAREFRLRNNSELVFDFGTLDFDRIDYSGFQAVITLGEDSNEDDQAYRKCKEIIQNKLGVIHQHIKTEHANEDSVMALVMELNLKLGGNPWLLPEQKKILGVVGIHSYLNPNTGEEAIFAIAQTGTGALLKHFDPIEPARFDELAKALARLNQRNPRILYLFSFDRFDIIERFRSILAEADKEMEYCIAQVYDQNYLRFFETWLPKKAPRFGKSVAEIARSQEEAYESAPQGVALKSDDDTFYLLTGKTLEKGATKRGCPTPIRLTIREMKGVGWNVTEIMNYVFALCMMGRASGHMTRMPAPLYYLQSFASYFNDFGAPKNENIKRGIFYI